MRRVEHGSRAFQAPVDVHASADGQIYLFKRRQNESAVSSDDEDHVVMDKKPQVCQSLERNIQFLEREVIDGDTLNKLALQYGCKVHIYVYIFKSVLITGACEMLTSLPVSVNRWRI